MNESEKMLSAQVPLELYDRIGAMQERVNAAPAFEFVQVSRSQVVRMALAKGLEALEQEFPEGGDQ